jgi:hypothetical protein
MVISVFFRLFVTLAACLLSSSFAFAPSAMQTVSRVAPTMAAERSRSLPFLLRPAKVSLLYDK